MPNVQFFFEHKLSGADFKKHKAWFAKQSKSNSKSPADDEVEVDFDLMIGADGAHSATRQHLMKYQRLDYSQEYIDTLWCEFHIPARNTSNDDSRFPISPRHLHIWPGQEFMFIAIPSFDGTFTCTLFMPTLYYAQLEEQPSNIPHFFDQHFPGVSDLIAPADLIASFQRNPHLPLISIKTSPYHFSDSVVIVGDAAHAMVPFFGQGMNAGLEDIRVLFSILDQHSSDRQDDHPDPDTISLSKSLTPAQRHAALLAYSIYRQPDAHAINDLALQNYMEMRAAVTSPFYKLRKRLEESLSIYVPRLGWRTKYARVSFSNERYANVVAQSERQGNLLMLGLASLVASPVLVGALLCWQRWRK